MRKVELWTKAVECMSLPSHLREQGEFLGAIWFNGASQSEKNSQMECLVYLM